MTSLAVGSEDAPGGAVYDLRMGGGRGPAYRLGENRSVKDGAVVDVQYDEVFARVCTATVGGVVKFYGEEGEGER